MWERERFNVLPVQSASFSPRSVRCEGHAAFPRILLPSCGFCPFAFLRQHPVTLLPRFSPTHFFFTLISLLSVVLCPSTLYRPNRRAEPWIWSCKEARSAVCLSHEISSITRLCPLPLQGVKNRFALFYHQRVKGFFKNLYLEATSGKTTGKTASTSW